MKRIMWFMLLGALPLIAMAAEIDTAAAEAAPTNKDTAQQEASAPTPEVAPGDLPENAPSGNLKETVSRSLLLFTPSEEIDVDRPVDFPTNI